MVWQMRLFPALSRWQLAMQGWWCSEGVCRPHAGRGHTPSLPTPYTHGQDSLTPHNHSGTAWWVRDANSSEMHTACSEHLLDPDALLLLDLPLELVAFPLLLPHCLSLGRPLLRESFLLIALGLLLSLPEQRGSNRPPR